MANVIIKCEITNPTRKKLLAEMGDEFEAHFSREDVGNLCHILRLQQLNQEFIDRGRGKAFRRQWW